MEENTIQVEAKATDIEKQWVKWLSEGSSYLQIAQMEDISKNVLAYKLTALRERFGCKNTTHLIALFLRNKLIE